MAINNTPFDPTTLQTFNKLYPMFVEKYVNSAVDPNASITDKMNAVIDAVNKYGSQANGIVNQWNQVMYWCLNDGLTGNVNTKLEAMNANHEFDSIINTTQMGDLTKLKTTDKTSIVNAINDLANINSNTESVIYFNADPNNVNDCTQAFINSMQNYEIVIVPSGNYKFNSALTILSSYKVRKIIGVDMNSVHLNFSGTDGIINQKSGVKIEGIGLFGSNTNSGFKLLASLHLKNCQVYSFNIGIDLSQGVSIISAFFEKVTVAYNKLYGVKVVSGANSQNNQITFRDLYIVKNGNDADTLTSNATIGSGDGMYISGAYSVLIESCVFEYNTGVGLRLDSQSYPLSGVSVISPYFERNKYGQLYVDNSTNPYSISGLNIRGEFYTDAGLTNVPNSLLNRQLYLTHPDNVLNNPNNNYYGTIGFSDRNFLTRRPNLLNAFPINRMSDLAVDYPNNIVTYNNDSVFQITNTVAGQTFNNELMYIDSIYDYVLSYDVLKVNASASPNLLAYLYDNDSSALIKATSTYLGGGAFGWQTTYSKITGLSASKVLRLYLNIEGSTPADLQVYIRNIRLIPIVNNAGAVNSNVQAQTNAVQNLVANTFTKVAYATKQKDALNEFDQTTNYRFTAQSSGTYFIRASLGFNTQTAGNRTIIAICKNGNGSFTETERLYDGTVGGAQNSEAIGSTFMDLVAGDTIEIYGFSANAQATLTGQVSTLKITKLY